MKRIALFLLTNVAVVVVLGIVASLLGVNRFLTSNGLNLGALLGFAFIMGFGGAIISLLISKPLAKWSSGVHVINEPRNADEAWIVNTVRGFADRAGIGMPEVGIYEGEPNAFATGAFKNSALVAVSTGLLEGMTREEVEAVIGHEVAHIANGDMVTMTLIQGVMNTFVVFLSRVIGYAVDSFLRKNDESSSGPGIGYYVTTIVLDIVLGFLAAIIVAWFSRQREFRADAGAAQLMGRKQPMMNALALADAMDKQGLIARVMSAIAIEQVVEPYVRPKALQYLEEGKVVVFAAGTGNPFFTTDTAAALRGAEIGAEVVLKATKVDGVYTDDPMKNPNATRYHKLAFDEAISRNLGIMDATAFALCRDQKLPIRVFSIIKPGALKRVVMGEDEGTLVYA